MPRICAVTSFYQDFEGGKRLYEHLHKHGIYSIWQDGRFPNFKQINNSDLSTDDLREFLESKEDALLLKEGEGLHWLHEKLTNLFHKAGELGYEYVILLGSDEYLEGDFQFLLDNLRMYEVGEPCYYRLDIDETNPKDRTNKDQGIERIFYKPECFTVDRTHWCYFIDGKRATSYPQIIKGIKIIHDDHIRTKERNRLMDDYQKINIKIEQDKFYSDIQKELIKKRRKFFERSVNV